ncbi:SusC/RagA family TonB-linked outer membrane protein [Niabella aquatica]
MKKTMQKMLLALLMSCMAMLSHAQQRTVSGTVTDEQGAPLAGVSYIVKGTNTGGVTTASGAFSVAVPNNTSILQLSYVGYQTQEIEIGDKTDMNITLRKDGGKQMDEVVVTALGIKRENRKLGYGMTTLSGGDVAKTNTINPVQALQGQVPGLSIGTSDGGLFGNSKIQLRGVASLNSNNNQPIFVIDGVILENSISNNSADWDGNSNDYGNILKNLNPEDFKSISVLRGAAATALYGSRGINGAIIIETKNGTGVKGLGISVKHTLAVDHVYGQPDLQYEFGEGMLAGYVDFGQKDGNGNYYRFDANQFYLNDKGIPTKIDHPSGMAWGAKFDGRKIIDYDGSETTYVPYKNNLLDAYQLGIGNTTSIALSGGNDKGNFYLSDAYQKRNGVLLGNAFERNALQFTGSYNLAKWLKAEGSVSFTASTAENPRNDLSQNFLDGTWMNYYDTKKYEQQPYWKASHGGVPNSNYGDANAFVPGRAIWFRYNMNNQTQKEYLTRPVVKLSAKLASWATLALEGNMNYYTTRFEKKEWGEGYLNEGGLYQLSHTDDVSRTGKITATFNKNFSEDISSTFIVGGEIWKQDKTKTGSWTDGGLINPGEFFLGNSKRTVISETNNNVYGTKQINSAYFLANFGYKDYLFVDVTGRNDWSSSLVYTAGFGNNSYFYPSVSTSWLANKTLNMPEWVSFAKLRASWAQVGSDTDPFFINKGYSVDKIELENGVFAFTNGIDPVYVNKDIKPEKKNSFEIGADLRFLKERLGIDISYYNDIIRNQIGTIPIDPIVGISNLITNIGTLRNRGIELNINATPVRTSNFKWNTVFNYWKNKTKVTELDDSYGEYKTLGGDIAYGNFRVGSVAYRNGEYGVLMSDILPAVWKSDDPQDSRNGMKILTWVDSRRGAYYARSYEVQQVGSMQPKFEGSWINNFSYKALTLSFQLDARFGGYLASYSNRYGTAYGFLETSLKGRDAAHGGVTWTSQYNDSKGQTFEDGIIPDGVFKTGTVVTTPTGATQNVGGMTYREAYEKGYIEPTHASYYTYRSNDWGNGVINSDWFNEVKYIALRNIFIGYNLPGNWFQGIGIRNANLALNIRNVAYLYNSLPNHLNPESFRGTSSTESFRERNFIPYTRNYSITLALDF